MKRFFRNNGLSIVFLFLFLISLIGQIITGWKEHNREREEQKMGKISINSYLGSGHFVQSTFENWESEFLQMALFVILTVSLRQKGSSESKSCDEKEEVDREPSARRKDAPWPVRKGGWILFIYKRSLSIALLLLFLLSFFLHLEGSLRDENEHLLHAGELPHSLGYYFGSSRFWFESFQKLAK